MWTCRCFLNFDPDFENNQYLDRCQIITLSYTLYKRDNGDLYFEGEEEN